MLESKRDNKRDNKREVGKRESANLIPVSALCPKEAASEGFTADTQE